MPKLPFMQFYPQDWLIDTRCLTPSEKAIWIDVLCFMWIQEKRGILKGQVKDLARMVGMNEDEFGSSVLKMRQKGVCDVKIDDKKNEKYPEMIIICRRMVKEQKSFIDNAFRMERWKKANEKRKINAKTTAKKSEVISQKSKDISADTTSHIPETVDNSVDNLGVEEKAKKPLTDVQKVVLVYKMASGYPKEDAGWDRVNFARCAKSAKILIEFLGSWENAADCIQEVYEKLSSKGLTLTIETIVKHASDWKRDKFEMMKV